MLERLEANLAKGLLPSFLKSFFLFDHQKRQQVRSFPIKNLAIVGGRVFMDRNKIDSNFYLELGSLTECIGNEICTNLQEAIRKVNLITSSFYLFQQPHNSQELRAKIIKYFDDLENLLDITLKEITFLRTKLLASLILVFNLIGSN